jgi:hypothetical protein
MTPPPPPISETLKRLLESAHIETANINHNPFSQNGFNRLTERVDEYLVQLVTESVRVAKRHDSDIFRLPTLTKPQNISLPARMLDGIDL